MAAEQTSMPHAHYVQVLPMTAVAGPQPRYDLPGCFPPLHTDSAQNRPGAAQQRQPPGCAGPGAKNDASRAAPPMAGLVKARVASSPQFGQGCGKANSAIGRSSGQTEAPASTQHIVTGSQSMPRGLCWIATTYAASIASRRLVLLPCIRRAR